MSVISFVPMSDEDVALISAPVCSRPNYKSTVKSNELTGGGNVSTVRSVCVCGGGDTHTHTAAAEASLTLMLDERTSEEGN